MKYPPKYVKCAKPLNLSAFVVVFLIIIIVTPLL